MNMIKISIKKYMENNKTDAGMENKEGSLLTRTCQIDTIEQMIRVSIYYLNTISKMISYIAINKGLLNKMLGFNILSSSYH